MIISISAIFILTCINNAIIIIIIILVMSCRLGIALLLQLLNA